MAESTVPRLILEIEHRAVDDDQLSTSSGISRNSDSSSPSCYFSDGSTRCFTSNDNDLSDSEAELESPNSGGISRSSDSSSPSSYFSNGSTRCFTSNDHDLSDSEAELESPNSATIAEPTGPRLKQDIRHITVEDDQLSTSKPDYYFVWFGGLFDGPGQPDYYFVWFGGLFDGPGRTKHKLSDDEAECPKAKVLRGTKHRLSDDETGGPQAKVLQRTKHKLSDDEVECPKAKVLKDEISNNSNSSSPTTYFSDGSTRCYTSNDHDLSDLSLLDSKGKLQSPNSVPLTESTGLTLKQDIELDTVEDDQLSTSNIKTYFACLGGTMTEERGQRRLSPQDVDLYLEPSISSRVKHLADIPGTVVYVKSPMMTILSPEDDIPVPQSVICDVFVIIPEDFVMLLTFVWDDPDSSDVSYNSHLVTILKSIFHTQIQTDVCVVGKVMGERERKHKHKFKKEDLKQRATRAPTRQVTDFDVTAKFQEFVSKERMTSTYKEKQKPCNWHRKSELPHHTKTLQKRVRSMRKATSS